MRNLYKKLALVFTTMALFTFVATSQTTVTYSITDGGDDVEEYVGAWTSTGGTAYADGYMDITSSDMELCTQNANNKQAVGVVFRGVAVPKNATIVSAFVQFICDDDDNQEGPLPIDVWGFKQDNTVAPFPDVPFAVTSRPVTTAKVTWNCPVWATKEAKTDNEKTPDLKAIVQEIVNQAGWASGNNMGFVFRNEELANIHREAAAVEDASGTTDLIITYNAGVAVEKIDASDGLVYPNPSEGKFMVKNPSSGNFGYGIYTMNGSMVRSRDNITGSTTEVDMSKSAKGQYFVIVKSANQTAKSKLILK